MLRRHLWKKRSSDRKLAPLTQRSEVIPLASGDVHLTRRLEVTLAHPLVHLSRPKGPLHIAFVIDENPLTLFDIPLIDLRLGLLIAGRTFLFVFVVRIDELGPERDVLYHTGRHVLHQSRADDKALQHQPTQLSCRQRPALDPAVVGVVPRVGSRGWFHVRHPQAQSHPRSRSLALSRALSLSLARSLSLNGQTSCE